MLLVGDGAGVGVGPGVGEEDVGVGVGDENVGVGRAKGVAGAQAPRSRARPAQAAAACAGWRSVYLMGQIVLETSKSGSGSKQKVAEPWPYTACAVVMSRRVNVPMVGTCFGSPT